MGKRAFTLIELLVVMAIIAILTAILFPVFNQVKIAAKRNSDIANMGRIGTALGLYRTDQGGYPPLLLGVVEYRPDLGREANVGEIRRGYLYNTREKDIHVWKSQLNDYGRADQIGGASPVYWPQQDQRSAGNPDDFQYFGPANVVTYEQLRIFNPPNGDLATDPARFYAWDSYDIAPIRTNLGTVFELRYTLFWTETAFVNGGSPNDNPRQLGYNDPPDNTVVTWNSFFRRYETDPSNNLVPRRIKTDMVLFLSGNVRIEDSKDVAARSWRFGQ